MLNNQVEKSFFRLYELLWKIAIPFLRKNDRMAEGFLQRSLKQPNIMGADLWIQSASAGEAYLALEILKRIPPAGMLKIMLTTNTSQGKEILLQAVQNPSADPQRQKIQVAYFPFDGPALMQKAIDLIHPRVMVLLESELWPGLLRQLKRSECRVLVINGRITMKSLSRYLAWPSFWRRLRPDKILAISKIDAQRFARLFGPEGVGVMPNIKFDRLGIGETAIPFDNRLDLFLPARHNFLILGSIRQEEEKQVEKIIQRIFLKRPQTVIGLFPRHMHRIDYWREVLNRLGISWRHRSEIKAKIPDGSVILWDLFGELSLAFRMCGAAFIGGSLSPLGGQNFLEPLICGIPPVIGPFWDNFKWIGTEIVQEGLVHEASSWKEVANILIEVIMNPSQQESVRQRALAYIEAKKGGADMAWGAIAEYL